MRFKFPFLILTASIIASITIIPSVFSQAPGSDADVRPGTDADVRPGTNGNITQPPSIGLQNPLRSDSICGLLKEIIKYMIWFAAPIYVGVVLYGAYQMLFAMGEPEKFKQGRTTILYATIAYAIVIIGWGFVNIVSNFLGAKSVIC